ncbi:MAG: InlB B-repeat-containing protein [Candidatus Borkfalkiaceae bacterium]|nr:InlB B-repeat-containing protein [Christensenellaceae bacterium]
MKIRKKIALLALSLLCVVSCIVLIPLNGNVSVAGSCVYEKTDISSFLKNPENKQILLVHQYEGKRYAITANVDSTQPAAVVVSADGSTVSGTISGMITNHMLWNVSVKSDSGTEYVFFENVGAAGKFLNKNKVSGEPSGDDRFRKENFLEGKLLYGDILGTHSFLCYNGLKYTNSGTPCDFSVYVKTTVLNTYTVTYSDGKDGQILETYEENKEITLPECSFEKEGYRFVGWKLGNDTYSSGNLFTVSGNTAFTAVWEEIPPETYTISFRIGEKTVTQTMTENVEYLLPSYDATDEAGNRLFPALAEGEIFDGWYPEASDERIDSIASPCENVTVTARIFVTVRFDLNGGKWDDIPTTYSVVRGETFTVPDAPTHVRDDKFEFLYFLSNGKKIHAEDTVSVSAPMTLVAEWNQVAFSVVFITDGQSEEWILQKGYPFPEEKRTAKKSGMKFMYWQDEDLREVDQAAFQAERDCTFTALFGYQITLVSGNVKFDDQVVASGQKYTFPTVGNLGEKEVFVGWIDETSSAEKKIYSEKASVTIECARTFRRATANFETANQAVLRLGQGLSDSGIQFRTLIGASDWDLISPFVSAGTMIARADTVSAEGFDFAHTAPENILDIPSTKSTLVGEDRRFSASIVNLHEYNYGRKFLARGYLRVAYADEKDAGYVYARYDADYSVSARELAASVLTGPWSLTETQRRILSEYTSSENEGGTDGSTTETP